MGPAVWIAIIAGITVITVTFFIYLILRSGKTASETHNEVVSGTAYIKMIDEASDAALDEINKTSRIVLDEIEKKYQAMLFLYNLLEEKKKEINAVLEQPVKLAANTPSEIKPPAKKQQSAKQNARNEKIFQLSEEGMQINEIAKELNIGQGEVKLILDLAGR